MFDCLLSAVRQSDSYCIVVMKRCCTYIFLLLCCCSCSVAPRIPFIRHPLWTIDRNYRAKEITRRMAFPLDTVLPDHRTGTITARKDYRKHLGSGRFVRRLVSQIPMVPDSMLLVVPGRLIVFESLTDKWDPDCDIITQGHRHHYIGCVHNTLTDRYSHRPFYVDRMMARSKWLCVVYYDIPEESAKEISREIYRLNLYFPEAEP